MRADWIKLHRKITKSAVWDDPLTLKVWIWLLVNANWEERQLINGIRLKPGELVIGQDKAAAELKTTRQKLRTSLKRLEKCQNLTSKSTSLGTHITICNWGTYQGGMCANQPDNQPTTNQRSTSDQPAANQPLTTEEESKKVRREEGKKKGVAYFYGIVPKSLRTDAFKEAWTDWIDHKHQKRQTYKETGAKRLLRRLAEMGPEKASAAIDYSIGNNYAGIFEPSQNGNGKHEPQPPAYPDLAELD